MRDPEALDVLAVVNRAALEPDDRLGEVLPLPDRAGRAIHHFGRLGEPDDALGKQLARGGPKQAVPIEQAVNEPCLLLRGAVAEGVPNTAEPDRQQFLTRQLNHSALSGLRILYGTQAYPSSPSSFLRAVTPRFTGSSPWCQPYAEVAFHAPPGGRRHVA